MLGQFVPGLSERLAQAGAFQGLLQVGVKGIGETFV